jgi:acetyltransferase-like isoleucine patch superfamily enzyme
MDRQGATYRHVLGRAGAPLLRNGGLPRRLRRRWARERLIIRLKTAAAAGRASVEVRIARDLDIAGQPQLEIYPETSNQVLIGSGVRIGDGVRISLRGGSFEVGDEAELRRLANYQVTGRLVVGRAVVLSHGVTVHCSQSVEIGDLTIVGEYTTITDSSHVRTPPDSAIHHATESAPVRVGRNVWVGAHAVITPGVSVGDLAFVGAAAVVTKDVAPGWLVGGVPAVPIRALPPSGE